MSAIVVEAKQEKAPLISPNLQDVLPENRTVSTNAPPSNNTGNAVENQKTANSDFGTSTVFIENIGQFDPRARFQTQANGANVYFSENAVWFTLLEPPTKGPNADYLSAAIRDGIAAEQQKPRKGVNLKVNLIGSNPHPTIESFNRVATSFSYFTGNNPANWQTDVPVWDGIRYVDVYPGMDLEITSEQSRLVWQFLVTDTSRFYDKSNQVVQQGIRIKIAGHQRLQAQNNTHDIATDVGTLPLPIIRVNGTELLPDVDANGDLIIPTPAQTSTSLGIYKTVSYTIPTSKELNLLSFMQSNSTTQTANRENVSQQSSGISPIYSAYFGTKYTLGDSIAVDSDGGVYVAGSPGWDDFPTGVGVFYLPGASSTSYDSFVAKIDLDTNQLIYTAFFKTRPDPECDSAGSVGGIAVDNNKNLYVVGITGNPDFPTTAGVIDRQFTDDCPGNPHPYYEQRAESFVLKLNAAGNQLLYSTFLGGSEYDGAGSIFVNEDGSAYVAGITYSTNIPKGTQGYSHTLDGLFDVFITKLSPAADQQEFFTYIGGSDIDYSGTVKVGNDGSVYLAGVTVSSDFPVTTDAYIDSYSSSSSCNSSSCKNAFAIKLDSTGNILMYATYLGEVGSGGVYDLDVDETGHAYIGGWARNAVFPHTLLIGPGSLSSNGAADGFAVKLSTDGKSADYSTLIGGTTFDGVYAISIDNLGNAYLVGMSDSDDFPFTSNAIDTSLEEFDTDLIIATLNPSGSQLTYATFFGGSSSDYMSWHGAPLDSNGNINILVRDTESTDFPTNHPPIGNGIDGSDEYFGWYTAAVVRFSTNASAYDCLGTPLSPIAQAVMSEVEDQQQGYCKNHFDDTSGLIILPPGDAAFERFEDLARSAYYEIDFTNMLWDEDGREEGDSPSRIFLRGVKALYDDVQDNLTYYPPEGVKVRILVGLKKNTWHPFKDQRVLVMEDLATLQIPRNDTKWQVEVAVYRDGIDAAVSPIHSHVKMMIVDGSTVVAAGYNMQYTYLNGGTRRDMGLQVSGPIAVHSLQVFDGLWAGAIRCENYDSNVCTQETTIFGPIDHNQVILDPTPQGNDIVFSLFRDDVDKTADDAIVAAINSANINVNVMQNRFMTGFFSVTPYARAILDALQQEGTQVYAKILVTQEPESALTFNTAGLCALKNRLSWEDSSKLQYLDTRYSKYPVHTKALSIDNSFVIVGSQNFDRSAWGDDFALGDLSEYNLAIDSTSGTNNAATEFDSYFMDEWSSVNSDPVICSLNETLQSDISEAAPGSIIFIPDGVYSTSFTIDKPLVIVGAGPNQTIIQPSGGEPAFQVTSSDVVIANMKISEGDGYGIKLIDSSPSSLKNIQINRVVFENNTQGGVLAQGLIPGSPMNYVIENNTFIGGVDGVVINMIETQAETSVIRDNIYSGQSNAPIHILSSDDSRVEYSYNLFDDCGLGDCAANWVQGSVSVTSNVHDNLFDLDPLFVNPEDGAYQLSAGSPAIDAGDPTLFHDLLLDGNNDGIIQIDLGAFEYDYSSVSNVAPVASAGNDQTITLGDDTVVNVTYSDADNTENHSARIDWGDGIVEDTPVNATGPGTGDVTAQHTYTSAGTYTVEVCVTDLYGAVGCDTTTIVVNNTFPLTPILDDFNRADGAIGNNWSGNTSGYNILSNQLLVKSKNANLDIYWNNTSFGPDQEVYFTFSSVSSTAYDQDLLLKAQDTSSWGAMIDVQYDATWNRVIIWTFAQGQSWVQYGSDIPVTFANGDQFGARALADGTVEVYRNGVLLATRDVTSWPYYSGGGYLGLWFGDAKNVLIDDFGGGNIP